MTSPTLERQDGTPAANFRIRGMDCGDESAELRREVGPLVGGDDKLSFDVLRGRMTDMADLVPADTIIQAINRTGMRAEPWTAENEATPREEEARASRAHGS